METDALLDDREALIGCLHLRHVGGVILWRMPTEREPNAAVVDANPVADLSPQQLEDRKAGGLAGNIPERHFDGADCAPPRFEAPQAPDLQHDSLHVRGVFTQQMPL